MNSQPVLTAASLASVLSAVATLVQEVEAIRTQVAENAQQVWDEVRTDYAGAVEAFEQASATVGHYNDARQSGQPAVEPAAVPTLADALSAGENVAHGAVTGA